MDIIEAPYISNPNWQPAFEDKQISSDVYKYIQTRKRISGNWGRQKPPAGSTIDWNHPLSKGMKLLYLMNNGGKKIENLCDASSHGTVASGTLNPGVLNTVNTQDGKVVRFDGVNFIQTKYNEWMNSQNLTIEAWAKPNNISGSANLVTRYYWEDTGRVFNINVNSTQISVTIWNNPVASVQCYSAAINYPQGKLSQFVVQLCAKTGMIRIFINGQQKSVEYNKFTYIARTAVWAGRDVSMTVGATYNGSGPFTGDISLVRIYDRVLTPDEVKSLYDYPYQMIRKPQIKHYPVVKTRQKTKSIVHEQEWGKNLPQEGYKVNRNHRLSENLVGFWMLNQNGKAQDLSGNGYDGKYSLTSIVNTDRGLARHFDYINNDSGEQVYIDLKRDFYTLKNNYTDTEWTFEFYFQKHQIRAAYTYNMIFSTTYSWYGCGCLFMFRDDNHDFVFYDYDNNEYAIAPDLIDGKWHHVVVRLSNVNQTVDTFVDGNLVTSLAGMYIPMRLPRQIAIGNFYDDTTYNFDGNIQYVRIWNEALSNSDIYSLYDNPFDMMEKPKRRYYLSPAKDTPLTGGNIVKIKKPYTSFKPHSGATLDTSNDLTRGLVSCWLMNSNGGNQVNDLVNNNHFKLDQTNPPTWKNNALWFNGTSNRATAPSNMANYFNKTNEMTMVALVNIPDTSVSRCILDNSGNYSLAVLDDRRFWSRVTIDGVSVEFYGPAINANLFGKKMLLVVTSDGKTRKNYLNGEFQGKRDDNGSITIPASNLMLGSRGTMWYSGIIDYVALYNRCLTAQDVRNLWNQPYQLFKKDNWNADNILFIPEQKEKKIFHINHSKSFWQDQKPPIGAQVNWEHPISKGLKFYAPLNELAGGSITDIVKRQSTFNMNNWYQMWMNEGLRGAKFNGSYWEQYYDFFNFRDRLDLRLNKNLTLEVWVYPHSNTGQYGTFFYHTGGSVHSYALYLWDMDGTTFQIYYEQSQKDADWSVAYNTYNSDLKYDQWHHIVVTKDINRTPPVQIIVNGKPIELDPNTGWPIPGEAKGDGVYLQHGPEGTCSDMRYSRIWDRALSLEEVRSLYKNPHQIIRAQHNPKYYEFLDNQWKILNKRNTQLRVGRRDIKEEI